MGTGKTSVGQLLAQRLDMQFVDTDDLIEARHGLIPQIFEAEGEAAFRDVERAVVAELGDREGLVIATGGGTVLDPENVRALSINGLIFCLVAAPETILRRVLEDPSDRERPMLEADAPALRISELLAQRQEGYSPFLQVPTDGRTPKDIADEIAQLWRTRN
jgi:shikimate kinase